MRNYFLPLAILLILSLASKVAPQIPLEKQERNAEQIPSAIDLLTGNTTEQKMYLVRKLDFVNATLTQITSSLDSSESVLYFQAKPPLVTFSLTAEELHKISQGNIDPIGDALRRRFMDAPPTLPLFAVFFLGNHQRLQNAKLSQGLPIPTDVEIDILKVLWLNPGLSSIEVYAQLDTLGHITFGELQDIMNGMNQRGFLARKKISRANEFSVFGIAEIELSPQNRRNRLYVYWPVVTKEKLITYLNSKRQPSFASAQATRYEKVESENKNHIEERLIRLIR
jgi:hypothetical protein